MTLGEVEEMVDRIRELHRQGDDELARLTKNDLWEEVLRACSGKAKWSTQMATTALKVTEFLP